MVAAIWSSRCSSVGRRKFITLGGAAGAGFRLVRLAVLARSNLSHMSLRSREHFRAAIPTTIATQTARPMVPVGLDGERQLLRTGLRQGVGRIRSSAQNATFCPAI